MNRLQKRLLDHAAIPSALLALGLALLLACSTDAPTAPDQVPAPDPGGGSAVWNVTVTVTPSVLLKPVDPSAAEPSRVEVRIRRRDNNQAPPLGTTAVVATNLGEFDALGSGLKETVIQLANGIGEALLFPGSLTGRATVVAQLEGSLGQAFVDIRDEDSLFIVSVSPSSGPQSGGTLITIDGVGFREPLQAFLGGVPAEVTRVANDGSFVRARTPVILDPQNFFATEDCDADGDGEDDGERFITTRVDLSIVMADGPVTTATLPGAFAYVPSDRSCREPPDPPEPPEPPFIQEVDPNSGPETGGQTVDIIGRGFRNPLRVFFQNKLATVMSVSSTKVTVVTPVGDLATTSCDDNNNGVLGIKRIDTPVQVKVEIIDGAQETLANAYTYTVVLPNPCVGD